MLPIVAWLVLLGPSEDPAAIETHVLAAPSLLMQEEGKAYGLAIQILSLATTLISLAGAVVAFLPKARGDARKKKNRKH